MQKTANKKPIIAVDADDTLFDENNAIRLFHNNRYGTRHTEEDYLEPGEYGAFWEHIWNVEPEELWIRYEKFIEYKLEHNLSPLPGALEVLQYIKSRFELVIVTSRDERGVAITHQALSAHFPDIFSNVHFVPLWGNGEKVTKAKICNEIGAEYLIDDNYDHCRLAADSGVSALLFGSYGWNRDKELVPGIVRVGDWTDVRGYFDGRS